MQLWKHLPRTRPMHACPRCRSDLTSQTVISHLWPLSVTRSKRSKTKELLNMKSAESCCLAAAELALQPNPRGCDGVCIHTFTTSQLNLQRPVPPAPTWTATLWFYECYTTRLKMKTFLPQQGKLHQAENVFLHWMKLWPFCSSVSIWRHEPKRLWRSRLSSVLSSLFLCCTSFSSVFKILAAASW